LKKDTNYSTKMYCLYYKSEKKNTNKRSRFECKKCNVGLCTSDCF